MVVEPQLRNRWGGGVTVVRGGLAPYALVHATIDPSNGGSLTSVDGGTTLNVAAGAADTLTISLMLLPPTADGSLPLGNLQVGTQMYALTVTDSSGNVVTLFDPQLQLVVNPSQADVLAAGGDLAQIAVAVLDPAAGSFVRLDTTTLADDSLAFVLIGLTPFQSRLWRPCRPTSRQRQIRWRPIRTRSLPEPNASAPQVRLTCGRLGDGIRGRGGVTRIYLR